MEDNKGEKICNSTQHKRNKQHNSYDTRSGNEVGFTTATEPTRDFLQESMAKKHRTVNADMIQRC